MSLDDSTNTPAPTGDSSHQSVGRLADRLFRHESSRLRATLLRRLGTGSLDLADDIVQETLLAALHNWRFKGIPDNPAAWLSRVAQNKAIDLLRRNQRFADVLPFLHESPSTNPPPNPSIITHHPDDPIRLMLLCAHPILSENDRIILTLALAAGFGTSEIARAFLLSHSAAEQRLTRAKRTLRESGASMELPDGDLSPRIASVLATLYLMLNEGHGVHKSDPHTRKDLITETQYLLKLLLTSPLTPEPARADVHALTSLTCFLAARINTRTDASGGLVLMEDQDRSLWDKAAIGEGYWHLTRSTHAEHLTPYGIEAAIASCHAAAPTFEETNWEQIVAFYQLLAQIKPTPIVLLNAAAAIAMHRGPSAGLAALDDLEKQTAIPLGGFSDRYYLVEATRGEILRRAGENAKAADSFRRALLLPCSEPEKQLLEARLREVTE